MGQSVTRFGGLARFLCSQAVLRSRTARALARPPRTVNPKGLALFLGATARGRAVLGEARARALRTSLRNGIEQQAAQARHGLGWGYPFPWQSRVFWAPAGTPNAVVTATVGWHLLEAAQAFGDEHPETLAHSAAKFLATGLNQSVVGQGVALSYTPADRTRVVNISALAARLLARVALPAGSHEYGDLAERLTRFVLQTQRADGSWPYAIDRGGAWEDSFHTGYVLEALLNLRDLGIPVPDDALARGFTAYERFFDADGGARLGVSRSSPLDAHSAAQGAITYGSLHFADGVSARERQRAAAMVTRITRWTLKTLWIPSRGFFAYRIQGQRRDEREFTRWVQAWVALGMAVSGDVEGSGIGSDALCPTEVA